MENNNQIILDGLWQWQKGYNKKWLIKDPGNWQQQEYPFNFAFKKKLINYKGYITLRKKIPKQIHAIISKSNALTFFADYSSDVAFFYINNTKIGQLGNVQPYRSGSYLQLLRDLKPSLFNLSDNYLTVVLYANDRLFALEGGNIRIGKSESVHEFLTRDVLLDLFILTICLIIGIYHLILAARRPVEKYNIVFGFFCIIVSFYWIFRNRYRDIIFPDPDIRMTYEYVALFFCGPTLLSFFTYFFERRQTLYAKIYYLYSIILAAVVIFTEYHYRVAALYYFRLSIPPACIYALYIILKHVRKKNIDAWYLLSGSLLLLFTFFYSLPEATDVINSIHISRYGFFLFIMVIAVVLANKFGRVRSELQDLNQKLDNSLVQRNGDYFLMNQLLKPLGLNRGKSEYFTIESFIRQKNQFKFKQRNSEIGGDFNITHNIKLRGKKYIVILNSDAMGQSMQGAGGALVFGAVFQSILGRFNSTSEVTNNYPERWLKNTFIELHKVFKKFDGSMLVSLFFALLDEEIGLLYYINAEHPRGILFRDKKASFFGGNYLLRKLGNTMQGDLIVQTFQLQPGDSIILGSDGRDDILLKNNNKDGKIKYNANDKLFISLVQKNEADLKNIVMALRNIGELTDDISLLKVTYNLKERETKVDVSVINLFKKAKLERKSGHLNRAINLLQEAMHKDELQPEIIKTLTKLKFESKEFRDATVLADKYLSLQPNDDDFIFFAAWCAYKGGQIDQALDFSERMRLRMPWHIKNLNLLAHLYLMNKNYPRVQKMLTKIFQLEPDNEKAIKIKKSLQELKK